LKKTRRRIDRATENSRGGDSLGAADAVEVLHALVADAQGRRFLATFQVGRVTLLVPAADFDLPLPAAVEASTTERTLYCCSHRVFGMCQLLLLLLLLLNQILLLPLHVLFSVALALILF